MLAEGPILLSGGFGTELGRRGCDTRLPLWSARALLDEPAGRAGPARRLPARGRPRPHDQHLPHRSAHHPGRAPRARATSTWHEDGRAPGPRGGGRGRTRSTRCSWPDRSGRSRTATSRAACRTTPACASCTGGGCGHRCAPRVDLVLVETMNTVREAVVALETAEPWLPAAVSFVCAPGARLLLSGETVADAVAAVEPFEPLADPRELLRAVRRHRGAGRAARGHASSRRRLRERPRVPRRRARVAVRGRHRGSRVRARGAAVVGHGSPADRRVLRHEPAHDREARRTAARARMSTGRRGPYLHEMCTGGEGIGRILGACVLPPCSSCCSFCS